MAPLVGRFNGKRLFERSLVVMMRIARRVELAGAGEAVGADKLLARRFGNRAAVGFEQLRGIGQGPGPGHGARLETRGAASGALQAWKAERR